MSDIGAMNGGHYCLVSVVLLLWINSWGNYIIGYTNYL